MTQNSPPVSPSPPLPANSPGNRLGRTALYVMLAGLLTSGVMLTVVLIFGDSNGQAGSQDLLPVVNMAVAIGGVLICWSIVLAIRAMRSGERLTLPLWVMNLATLPLAAFGLIWWFEYSVQLFQFRRSAFSLGLPVFLPFISVTCVSGTIIIRSLSGWFEWRHKRTNKPDFTRRQRAVRLMLMCVCYAALLAIIILPISLRVQSEINSVVYPDRRQSGTGAIFLPSLYPPSSPEIVEHQKSWLSMMYSNFINDKAERILSLAPNHEWKRAQVVLISRGDLSFQRLSERTFDTDDFVAEGALQGIETGYPKLTAGAAFDLIRSCRNGTLKTIPHRTYGIVALNGSFEQKLFLLESLLDTPSKIDPAFIRFIDDIPRDVRFVPTYKEILKSSSMYHLSILNPLLEYLTDQEALEMLEELWKSSNQANQQAIRDISTRNGRAGTLCFNTIMDQAPLAIRRERLSFRFRNTLKLQEAHFINALIKLLENDDMTLRRGSATMLVQTLNFDNQLLDSVRPMFRSFKGSPTNYEQIPIFATPEELEAIKVIREKAEAWVAEHEKDANK